MSRCSAWVTRRTCAPISMPSQPTSAGRFASRHSRSFFTRLMTFSTGQRQMPLVLIADDDSAKDVNDLALMLRGELLSRGFPPRRLGGQGYMTLLHDRVRVPE